MSEHAFDVETLRHGLVSLPQEVWDSIYNAVFTAPFGIYYPAKSKASKPDLDALKIKGTYHRNDLGLLHIDRASRELYAESYYGQGNTFVFVTRIDGPGVKHTGGFCSEWFEMLPIAHRKYLPKVILVRPMPNDMNPILDAWEARTTMLMEGYEIHNVANVYVSRDGTLYGREVSMALLADVEDWNVPLERALQQKLHDAEEASCRRYQA